ncbi:hypothetical protein H6G17_19805 [Chroococcidiopsis sp. FACHB-1243]|uniref:hypothetical protein n=1 Tax=Chroococcidiopsis sp. [FACHB-1243] TaxID=2692781 RepID=UPI00177E24B6|nr:hypothetical protein [Chroococcidiopsis sp. [FACHB-1243]]MBD2307716.1 hypothetical protein [Chroococcidiopsis sp. [FACHB-1243]]
MHHKNRIQPKKVRIVGTVFGSLLIGIPAIPLVASAQGSQVLNPCPKIYYEEPFNSTRLAPEGCPPNTATRLLSGQGQTAQQPAEVTPSAQPPLPEARANAIASVMPMDGNVNVRLKNNTNTLITYEAIGYTGRRSLPGGEEIVLRNLPVPVTITTVRQDDGLVDVTPIASEEGVLEVSLNESKNLDDNAGALRIQKDGQVFLN